VLRYHPPVCVLCGKALAASTIFRTKCAHEFHKSCIAIYAKKKPTCPTCSTVCVEKPATPNTRSQGKTNLDSPRTTAGLNQSARQPSDSNAGQTESSTNVISEAVRGMQSELMAQLSREMGQLIRSTIAAQLQPISEQLSQH